ncbi:MAG TPA: tRNA (guanosine(46)-N7)-methyltransferase TrmB [Opitutaceae bacterium]|nr:tRNA (guanosine(46)-N7)-methyltransferase TrmB [Opitutaceae bacterium]
MRPARILEHASRIAERRDLLRKVLLNVIPPSSRLVWEIGSGHGHFLVAYAAAHPGELCIGIDIASGRIARANRKRERARLKNLHFVRADADDFLEVMPRNARLAAIFILFPDPWPKRRHSKKRIIKPEFLGAAAAAAAPAARLYFRTDHEPYFREAAAAVRAHPDWEAVDPAAWPFDEPTVFQKRAERFFSLVAARR